MFHVLCSALWVKSENDTDHALKELTVFNISHTVFLLWKEWWLIHSAAENLVVLLSHDCECQSLCPICVQKNQLRGF